MKTHLPKQSSPWRTACALALVLILGASLQEASAKTYTVKNLDDAGNGSLRSALQKLANSNDASNTVIFKSGLNGIIQLHSPLPDIDNSVSVTGPGANKITVTAPNGGAFDVVSGVVSLSGLTVQGRAGDASAVIRNQFSVLTIEECVITSKAPSTQVGIVNEVGGTTLIASSSIVNNRSTGNGGGIRNQGSLNIINSTFACNSASKGAALFNQVDATASLVNCTLADNAANIAGGGIYNDGGTVTIANSIVARNGAPAEADVHGVFASSGHNLISSTVGGSGFMPSDITNIPSASLGLAATIAVNEGPTPTLALLAGSLAIDAGSNALALDADGSVLAFDQRGAPFHRIVDSTVDIGAFESDIAPAPENARAYKQRALMTISACLPSCDHTNAFYLRWAANRISASLESWLWIDGDHLSCYGFFAFLREQQAVWYLKKVTGPCASAAQDAINDLVTADEKIAAAALNAAAGAPGENYAKALSAYNNGVAAASGGNAFSAISWYSWCWWYSTKALTKQTVYDDECDDYHYHDCN